MIITIEKCQEYAIALESERLKHAAFAAKLERQPTVNLNNLSGRWQPGELETLIARVTQLAGDAHGN